MTLHFDTSRKRLNGWKEIASFFGKDERTVKRWEALQGLPVRRVPGGTRGTVYAEIEELNTWLAGHGQPANSEPPQEMVQIAPTGIGTSTASGLTFSPRNLGLLGAAIASTLVFGFVGGQVVRDQPTPRSEASDAIQPPGPTASIEELYLDGLYNLSTRTAPGLSRAVENFTQIVSREPNHARAYAQLATAYNLLTQYALMPADIAYPQAKSAAERAIALDPTISDAYAALAFTEHYWFRDFARARDLFQKAIGLDPRSAKARHWYALTRMQAGDFPTALRLIGEAQEIDPESRSIQANKALILFHGGDSAGALRVLRQLESTAPGNIAAHFYMATIHLDEGDLDEYLRESLEAARLQDNMAMRSTFEAAWRGYRSAGSDGLFSAMLTEQQRQFDAGKEKAFNVARTAGLLGDKQTAVAFLAKSIERNEQDILGIRIDRSFRKLWTDPDFRALAAKVGLPFPEGQASVE